jgi:predicted membrane protein
MTGPEPLAPAVGVRSRLEAVIPAAILILRLVLHRTPWYFDWMIVLSAYWMLLVFLEGKKARTMLTLGAMVLLLAIYMVRVLPILADTCRFCL